jgi:hypothetical protein
MSFILHGTWDSQVFKCLCGIAQARIQTDATDASASVKIFTRTRIVNIFKYI